jgi:Peptidase family M1 domain
MAGSFCRSALHRVDAFYNSGTTAAVSPKGSMLSVMKLGLCLTGLALAGTAVAVADSTANELAATYHQLQRWQCAAEPLLVPAEGLRFSSDLAEFTLAAGQLRPLQPTSAGADTGFLFEGSGRFTMAVPDAVEQAQLGRFTARPGLMAVDQTFDRLLLRTSTPVLADFTARHVGTYGPCARVADRHVAWLTLDGTDADARTVAGLADARESFLRAEMDSADFGRLLYEFDGSRPEEITLQKFTSAGGFPFWETWLSLDRAEDRLPSGRPSDKRRVPFRIPHVDLAVELLRSGREARLGVSDTDEVNARIVATLTLDGEQDGVRVLRLELDQEAEVASIAPIGEADAGPLVFLRDPIGTRSSSLHKWVYDDALLVLLDRPLGRGERRQIAITYDLNLGNYAPGRSWYPGRQHDFSRHSARLTLTTPRQRTARAMGSLVAEETSDQRTTTVWEISPPTQMVTFSFAEKFREERVQVAGAPEVIAFASRTGTGKNKLFNVAADVANCIAWLQQLLDSPLGGEQIYATSILAGHGQSFEGFLHLSEASFTHEERGPTELFRCHEVAHQWWGHHVSFATYRDQWLTEALAEYSALLFLEAQPKDGPELFQEAIAAASYEVLGSLKNAMSRFAQPWAIPLNDAHRARLGPISLGYRAATGEIPSGYQIQSYRKGSLVLHMLRVLLRNVSKSDDLFVSVLRDFVAANKGKEASTADFVAALTRQAPSNWDWFFAQWIDGTAIPTYTWSHQVSPAANGGAALVLRVRQGGVPAGFRMPVPVRLEFADKTTGQVVVAVAKADETFTIPLPKKPTKVIFNPDVAVLAVVKKD